MGQLQTSSTFSSKLIEQRKMMINFATLEIFHNDVLSEILSFISKDERAQFIRVSKQWFQLIYESKIIAFIGTETQFEKLLKSLVMEFVSELDISMIILNERHVQLMRECKLCMNVKRISFGVKSCPIYGIFANTLWCSAMERLDFSFDFKEDDFVWLCHCGIFKNLKHVKLHDCQVVVNNLQYYRSKIVLEQLTELYISSNPMGQLFLELLKECNLSNLRRLSLIDASHVVDLGALTEIPSLINLKSLNLSITAGDKRFLERFCNCSHFKSLTELVYTSHLMNAKDLELLFSSPFTTKLTSLDISSTDLYDNVHILFGFPSRNLRKLFIRDCNIYDGNLLFNLLTSPLCKHLVELDISNNVEDCTEILVQSCHNLIELKKLTMSVVDIHSFTIPFKLPNLRLLNLEDMNGRRTNYNTKLPVRFKNY